MFQKDAMFMSRDVLTEVQRTNHFNLLIEDLPQIVSLAVNNSPVPNLGIDVVELHHGNSSVKVAGKRTVEMGDVAFKDFINAKTAKTLYNWHIKAHDPKTGKMGTVDQYKKDARLILYDPSGNVERTWVLEGCWLSTFVHGGELSYEGSDPVMVTGTLTVDNAYLE